MKQMFFGFIAMFILNVALCQTISSNIFLGTSGDHGQLSPAASFPFRLLSICPNSYPNTHTGYEYKAGEFLGFTHNRFEGVGCMGSGGAMLIKPFIGEVQNCKLLKQNESGEPGYYDVSFTNGLKCNFVVAGNEGVEQYIFPKGNNGISVDLSSALPSGFIDESHTISSNEITGWIQAGTTCRRGSYKLYYALRSDKPISWKEASDHVLVSNFSFDTVSLRIAFSSVSTDYAKASLTTRNISAMRSSSTAAWKRMFDVIQVKGDHEEEKLFYSLLYRVLQSPYNISEPDGAYRAIDGSIQNSKSPVYNGWSIWDNYKTQLPLLSVAYPEQFQDMITSIANLYRFGKKDWATSTEPSNTVRTEHAIVVLLDAYRKGYKVDFGAIADSLINEANKLDFSRPDKALESSYDCWALSQILFILQRDSLAKVYLDKAANYKQYWTKEFKDLSKRDIDDFGARGMYQGTIWQYRWFVPFDAKGLVELCGGDSVYIEQLNEFFDNEYYNAANEPDIQVPYMYNFSSHPWSSQAMIHKYAKDTVVQYYTDQNYRGIDPQIGRVYNNRPDAFLRSMDDDAGAMSSLYVLAACGLSPACVGWPVYYLSVPLFEKVTFNKKFTITVKNFSKDKKYIESVKLNGKPLDRNWLTQNEIMQGGTLDIIAAATPNTNFGIRNQFITDINKRVLP